MQLFGKVVAAAGTRGNALVCVEAIGAGQPILRIAGPRVAEPGIYTIQCGETAHIHAEQSAWAFINHACEPNCAIEKVPSQASRAPSEDEQFESYRKAVIAMKGRPRSEEHTSEL